MPLPRPHGTTASQVNAITQHSHFSRPKNAHDRYTAFFGRRNIRGAATNTHKKLAVNYVRSALKESEGCFTTAFTNLKSNTMKNTRTKVVHFLEPTKHCGKNTQYLVKFNTRSQSRAFSERSLATFRPADAVFSRHAPTQCRQNVLSLQVSKNPLLPYYAERED